VIGGASPEWREPRNNAVKAYCFFFQKDQLPHLGWIIAWNLITAPVFSQ